MEPTLSRSHKSYLYRYVLNLSQADAPTDTRTSRYYLFYNITPYSTYWDYGVRNFADNTYLSIDIYILGAKEDTAGLLYWEALNQLFVGVYTMDLFLIGLFILQNVLGPMIVAIILLAGSALVQNYVRTKLHPLIKFVSASRNEFGS